MYWHSVIHFTIIASSILIYVLPPRSRGAYKSAHLGIWLMVNYTLKERGQREKFQASINRKTSYQTKYEKWATKSTFIVLKFTFSFYYSFRSSAALKPNPPLLFSTLNIKKTHLIVCIKYFLKCLSLKKIYAIK